MRDAGTDPETIDRGGGPNHLRSSLGLPFAALPLIVILDVASASILRSGPVLDGVSLAILCFHVGARAAVLAALLGIAFLLAGAAGRAAGRAGWRRPSPELLLWWVALSAGFLVLTDPLTRGMMISRHPRVELLRLLIRVGGPALIACVLVGWSLLPHRLGSLGRRRRAGATFLCLALGLAVVNLSWLRHYPELHTLLGVLIVAAVLAAVRLVMMESRWDVARSWRACAGFLLLGGVVFAGGLLARRHARILPVLAAEDVLAPVVTEWNGITSPLLAFLAPLAPPPVPRRIVVRKADPAEIQAALDEVVPGRRRMNVLWIAVDSLRHDRTGFTPLGPPGGNERRFDENPVTPHLDELAREAFVFRRAYTTYPTSNYAFLSAMTGVPAGATILKTGAETRPDSPAAWPLARVLGDRGWFTLGVTSFQRAHADAPEWFAPLKRGFAVYNPHQEDHGAYASVVTATFLREISKPERRPFFGFLHFFGPHMPYGDAENRVVFGGGSPRLLDLYDSDTRNADEWIGRIIATLRERRLLERSLLVIFSDHGESFGEVKDLRDAGAQDLLVVARGLREHLVPLQAPYVRVQEEGIFVEPPEGLFE